MQSQRVRQDQVNFNFNSTLVMMSIIDPELEHLVADMFVVWTPAPGVAMGVEEMRQVC
jgi:hypothetical protein